MCTVPDLFLPIYGTVHDSILFGLFRRYSASTHFRSSIRNSCGEVSMDLSELQRLYHGQILPVCLTRLFIGPSRGLEKGSKNELVFLTFGSLRPSVIVNNPHPRTAQETAQSLILGVTYSSAPSSRSLLMRRRRGGRTALTTLAGSDS